MKIHDGDDFSKLIQGVQLVPSDDMLPETVVGGRRFGVDAVGGAVIKLALRNAYETTMLAGRMDEASIVRALRKAWDRPTPSMTGASNLVVNGLGILTGLNRQMKGPTFLGAADGSRDFAGSIEGIGFGPCVLNASFEDMEAISSGAMSPRDIDWRHSPLLVLSDVTCSDSDTPDWRIELPEPYIGVPILSEEIQLLRAVPLG